MKYIQGCPLALTEGLGGGGGRGIWLGCRHTLILKLRAKEGNDWGLGCRQVLKFSSSH